MKTVSIVAASLQRQLNNQASFMAVTMRVFLRTGVNLREPKPGHDSDDAVVMKVCTALADMGYRL